MFFEDEKDNLENLDNLEGIDLDLGDDVDDDSIDWDELLKEDEEEIVSVADDKSKPVAKKTLVSAKADAQPTFSDLTQNETLDEAQDEEAKKDAFEVFGGSEEDDLGDIKIEEIDDNEEETPVVEAQPQVEIEDLSDEAQYTKQVGIPQEKNSKLPAVLGVVLAAAVAFGAFLYFGNKPKTPQFAFKQTTPARHSVATPAPAPTVEQPTVEENVNDIPIVDEKEAKTLKPEKKITVSVESTGRVNPFLPTSIGFSKDIYSGIPTQSLLPPDAYGEDMDAQDLMRVSISGILYDNVKPSAIITINNMDYFVQKGDIVDDYKILDINRQAVVVQKGSNIYKAGVGEMLNRNYEISDGGGMVGTSIENGARHYVTVSESEVEVKTKTNSNVRTRSRAKK